MTSAGTSLYFEVKLARLLLVECPWSATLLQRDRGRINALRKDCSVFLRL